MKNWILIISFLFLTSHSISAHTCDIEKVKCPIDGTTVEFCVTMSMTTFGGYLDFQKKGAIGNHYEQLINCCKKCNFSGYLSDFKRNYTDSEKDIIKNILSKYNTLKLSEPQQCNVAGELKIALKDKNDEVANCFLVGSYLARFDKSNKDLRIQLQKNTIEYLSKAIDENEYEEDDNLNATIYYLIGDLYRRIDNFNDSIKYFNLSSDQINKEDWLEEILDKQKKLSEQKDNNNEI